MQTASRALQPHPGSLQPRSRPPPAFAALKSLREARLRSVTRLRATPEQRIESQGKPVDAEWVQEVAQEVMDTRQLGQRGEAYFVAQVVVLALVAFPPPFLRPLLDAAGWAAILGGLALVVAGQQALGRNLTPLPVPRESGALVTGGAFEFVRHPMYGGLLLAAGGLSLASGDELRLLLSAVAFFVLDRKASVEEAALVERFGEAYTELQRRTKKLIPYVY